MRAVVGAAVWVSTAPQAGMKAAMGNTAEVKALQQLQVARSTDRHRKLLEHLWTVCTYSLHPSSQHTLMHSLAVAAGASAAAARCYTAAAAAAAAASTANGTCAGAKVTYVGVCACACTRGEWCTRCGTV